jgi:hypothetical protein
VNVFFSLGCAPLASRSIAFQPPPPEEKEEEEEEPTEKGTFLLLFCCPCHFDMYFFISLLLATFFLLLSRIKYGIDLAPKYFPSPLFYFLTITEPGRRRRRTCFVTSSVPHTRQPTRKKKRVG